jgi:hypothetical protein
MTNVSVSLYMCHRMIQVNYSTSVALTRQCDSSALTSPTKCHSKDTYEICTCVVERHSMTHVKCVTPYVSLNDWCLLSHMHGSYVWPMYRLLYETIDLHWHYHSAANMALTRVALTCNQSISTSAATRYLTCVVHLSLSSVRCSVCCSVFLCVENAIEWPKWSIEW